MADRLQQALHQRLDQVAQGRLAGPAQAQAGYGDAQLGGSDVAIQIVDRAPHHPRRGVAFLDQGFNTRPAHADQSELRRDEKGVEQHQAKRQHKPGKIVHNRSVVPYGRRSRLPASHPAGWPGTAW